MGVCSGADTNISAEIGSFNVTAPQAGLNNKFSVEPRSDPRRATALEMGEQGTKTLRSQTACFIHQSVPNLDEWCAAKEEPEHVCHDVIADHTGNWDDEPRWEKNKTIRKCQDQTTPRLK